MSWEGVVCACMILTQPERGWRFCRRCQARLRRKGLRFMSDGRVKEKRKR